MRRNKGLKRSLSTEQLKMRQLVFTFDGASDTISGFDEFGIKEVIDSGAGLHTFVLANPFERACLVSGFAAITADTTVEVVSTAFDRVTVQAHVAGAAADAHFTLTVIGSDARFNQ